MFASMISSPAFWLIVLILVDFAVIFLTLLNPVWKARFFRLPRWAQRILVPLNVLPAWLLALAPQPKLLPAKSLAFTFSGSVITCLAIVIWLTAMSQIGFIPSIKSKERVISTGPYRLVRHPLYLGNLLFPLGLALLFRASVALYFIPVLAVLYSALIVIEEKGLLAEYGEDYKRYREKVAYRLLPLLF